MIKESIRAIRMAANNGYSEIVRLLLEDNNEAIIMASRYYPEVMRLLLRDETINTAYGNNLAIRWVGC